MPRFAHVLAFFFGGTLTAEVIGVVQGNDTLALTAMVVGTAVGLAAVAFVAVRGARDFLRFHAARSHRNGGIR